MDLERIYLVVNGAKPEARHAVERLTAWCRERGIEALPIESTPEIRREGAVVVALGGDGTVLRAAAAVAEAEVPVLGVNVGSLGFLSQAPRERLLEAVQRVVDGQFTIEERMRLRYDMPTASGTVLNDVVVTGVDDFRFCEVTLDWGGNAVASYPGDGLILATATGSTAYSLSAGGPIVVPPAACLVATPLAAHRLGVRPILFAADDVLRVRALQPIQVFADGDPVGRVEDGTDLVVRRAARPTLLIRLADAPSFFRVLDEKLNGPDVRGRRRDR